MGVSLSGRQDNPSKTSEGSQIPIFTHRIRRISESSQLRWWIFIELPFIEETLPDECSAATTTQPANGRFLCRSFAWGVTGDPQVLLGGWGELG